MPSWVLNVGDPVLISSGGEKYEGILLATFTFKGTWHYIVDIGETFICSTVCQPNKRTPPLVRSTK